MQREIWWKKSKTNIRNKEYNIFTTEFDEIAKAETLETAEEILKLRKNLDQQLVGFQDLVTRLANKLQRQLLAKQNRSWEFDLDCTLISACNIRSPIQKINDNMRNMFENMSVGEITQWDKYGYK